VSRGWLPGVLLVVGLAAVITIVATASNVSIRILSQIHADAASLHEVGGTYVAGWTSPEFNPFVDGRFRLLTLLLTVVYLVSTTAIGAFFVGLIRGSERWPRAVRILAGFLPGYLMVLAPLQLLFAVMGLTTAAWIALLTVPTVAVVTQRRAVAATASGLRHDRGYRRRWLLLVAVVGFILLLCGLHHLQYGRYFMVPDSISDFLNTAGQQMRGVFGDHLAQWDQQSDEWVFNAPLMFYSSHGQDFLFPIYATEFVGLASFACLVFGVVHSFAWHRPLLAAGLTTGAVIASTPSILPWYHIALVGGQNPMLWLGHPGRMIGVVGPWVALLVLGRWSSPRAAVAILLTTAGLAFTSSSGTLYVVAAVTLAGVWRLLRGRGPVWLKSHVSTVAVTVVGLVAVVTPAFVYWGIHRSASPNGFGWVLAGGAVAAGLAALVVALTSRPGTTPPLRSANALVHPAAWVAALGTGFVLSNNLVGKLADGQVRDVLASALPGYGLPLESRGYTAITSNLHFPTFTGQECAFSGHCVSFPYFLAAYGFLTVLALTSWLALGQRAGGEDAGPRRAAWLMTVAALICSLALVDFTGVDQVSAWVLTRFIEVPYYALLGLAALAFAGSRSRVTTWVGATVIAAWTVIPLAFSHVIPQLGRNASWLIGAIN
jgi:hypothetical protein